MDDFCYFIRCLSNLFKKFALDSAFNNYVLNNTIQVWWVKENVESYGNVNNKIAN